MVDKREGGWRERTLEGSTESWIELVRRINCRS
jgi:hypothetical protein